MNRPSFERPSSRGGMVLIALTMLSFSIPFVLLAEGASAQSIAGPATIVVEEISNTCGDPLGPPDVAVVDIEESGSLIAVGVPAQFTDTTPIEGKRAGSSATLGFEVFEEGGATLYDPAASVFTINPGATSIDGSLSWEFFGVAECSGTESWSATRPAAGTPGDLSGGGWLVTIVTLTDSCGPVDATPVQIPVSFVQSGSLVEVIAPDFGQTRIRGRVTGQSLELGLALREGEFDPADEITVYDAGDSALVIDGSFDSFSGTMQLTTFEPRVCSGVDQVHLALPEPGFGAGLLLSAFALAGARRRRER